MVLLSGIVAADEVGDFFYVDDLLYILSSRPQIYRLSSSFGVLVYVFAKPLPTYVKFISNHLNSRSRYIC